MDDKDSKEKTVKIPLLKRRADFRLWRDRFLTHLRTKEIVYHVQYEINEPVLLWPMNRADDFQIPNVILPATVTSFPGRLPLHVKDALVTNNQEIEVHHAYSSKIPYDLLSLAADGFVITQGNQLYYALEDRTKWLKAMRKIVKEQLVANLIKSTVSKEHIHMFNVCKNNHTGFLNLEKTFLKEADLEQAQIISRIQRLKYKNIRTYINQFNSLVSEFEDVGGSRLDTILHTLFLKAIPETYGSEKNLYSGRCLDEALDYFRLIGDRESTFKQERPTATKTLKLRQPTRNSRTPGSIRKTTSRKESYKHKLNYVKPPAITVSRRCQKCGGFGHSLSTCPTTDNVCHICGDTGHFKKQCPLSKKYVRTVRIRKLQTLDDDGDVNDEQHEVTNAQPDSDEDESCSVVDETADENQVTSEESMDFESFDDSYDSIGLQMLKSLKLYKIETTEACSCRFKSQCLRAIVDSGASCHVTNQLENLTNVVSATPLTLETACGRKTIAKQKGKLTVSLSNNVLLTLEEVYYTPDVTDTLVSTSQLVKAGYHIQFTPQGAQLLKNGLTWTTAKYENGAYVLHCSASFSEKQVVRVEKLSTPTSEEQHTLLHYKFGHVNTRYLSHTGLIGRTSSLPFCDCCAATKLVSSPHAKGIADNTTLFKAAKPFSKIHGDTIGPFKRSLQGYRFGLLLVDNFIRSFFFLPMKTKFAIPNAIIGWITHASTRYNAKVIVFMSDNGSEFVNSTLQTFFAKQGIQHEVTVPQEPHMNGLVERSVRTIKTTMRSLLYAGNVSKRFWPQAGRYAAQIWNVIPRSPGSKSPFEKLTGVPPRYSRFYVFGSRGFTTTRSKQQLQSNDIIIYLGFSASGVGYCVYSQKSRSLRTVRDIKLNELSLIHQAKQRYESKANRDIASEKSPVQSKPNHATPTLENEDILVNTADCTDDEPQSIRSTEPQQPSTQNSSAAQNNTEQEDDTSLTSQPDMDPVTNPQLRDQPNLAEISTGNIIDHPRRTQINRARLNRLAILKSTKPPKKYSELAYRSDRQEWIMAYNKEMNNLQEIGQMSVVPRPSNERIVQLLELFVVKFDNLNNTFIPKVRFVARGDLIKTTKSYYSPVASQVAFRIFCFISLKHDLLPVKQMDISNAFIYGRLEKPIYIQLPSGHPRKQKNEYVWRTQSSIYGLNEAPQVWNKTIDAYLKSYGFIPLISEPCLYFLRSRGGTVEAVLLLYVDDILFCGTAATVSNFQTDLKSKFKVKTKEKAEEFIGVQLQQQINLPEIVVHQQKHILEALKKFDLVDGQKVYSTPADATHRDVTKQEIPIREVSRVKEYQAKVGTLNYLSVCTRPDLAYAVCALSQKASKPSKEDFVRINRCLLYLKGTTSLGLPFRVTQTYQKTKDVVFKVYVDSSFANDASGKSIYGYLIQVDGALIHWRSKITPMVCLSTTESEYVAVALSLKDVEWVFNMMTEAGFRMRLGIVYCDNQGAVKIFQSESSTARTKHLHVKLQFARNLLKQRYHIRFIQTQDNLADVFTKALPRLQFNRLVTKLMTETQRG